MKRIYIILALLITTLTGYSQYVTNLVIVSNPPGTLIEWDQKILTYIIVNQTGAQGRPAILKTEIKTLDGANVGTTNLAKARVFTPGAGSTVLGPADVIPLEQMIFTGKYKTTLDRTGKLPADNYQICVQMVTPIDYQPMSEVKCRNFNLAAYQLPIPTVPYNESIVALDKARTTITFRWTPVTPRPAQELVYRIRVFEVLRNQTPVQAMRSNQPLLDRDIISTTQYIWQHQLPLQFCSADDVAEADSLQKGRNELALVNGLTAYTFIWTIQTFDLSGHPFGDGNINHDGITEPVVFSVDRRVMGAKPAMSIIYLSH